MDKDSLFEKFKELFPIWSKLTSHYEKIGTETLRLQIKHFGDTLIDLGESTMVFMYVDENNWYFGTREVSK